MLSILNSIQGLVNLLFLVAIVGTVVVSWIYADRLKKQYHADFPWSKTASIVGIEVLLWIGFNFFWEIFEAFWLPILVVAVIVIAIILSRKKRRYV
jgi:energy-converting hydrogenase Eha subunit G